MALAERLLDSLVKRQGALHGAGHFRKSWGAEPAGDGCWTFRLWAPGVDGLTLHLGDQSLAMDREAEGWFACEAMAAAGDAYGFTLPDGLVVPDPTARAQVGDVHGLSKLVNPNAYEWRTDWSGRPWHETVLSEVHVGTVTPEGTFDGLRRRLDHFAQAGFTAVELCPVAQFGGVRGWGYDGVLMYCPHNAYGGPDDMKRLVDEAHARDLMVFLDVVYNHFGPDGNYLGAYAPDFFHPEKHTPWGAAIAYDRKPVRDFFIENALFWLHEYRIDGLRLDAVDQIDDQSDEPLLEEIARAVRDFGFSHHRHLTTEDDRNIVSLHERAEDGSVPLYDGEWNDDFHHVAHTLATGEAEGYYLDYAGDPRGAMLKVLSSGYYHQGDASPYRKGEVRGEPSGHLPPVAFVNFLQNHDQTGNRAFGERLTALAEPRAVEVLTALLMLAPTVPLFFQGEEWAETRPFRFFTDFEGDLADAVREGRRREFAVWPQFADEELRATIPDPNAVETFEASRIDWDACDTEEGRARLDLFRRLASIRAERIAPLLAKVGAIRAETTEPHGERGLEVTWRLDDGARLTQVANLGGPAFHLPRHEGEELFVLGEPEDEWSIRVTLER